jgi:hypothetical protein
MLAHSSRRCCCDPYLKGFKPMSLYGTTDNEYVRACPGGRFPRTPSRRECNGALSRHGGVQIRSELCSVCRSAERGCSEGIRAESVVVWPRTLSYGGIPAKLFSFQLRTDFLWEVGTMNMFVVFKGPDGCSCFLSRTIAFFLTEARPWQPWNSSLRRWTG